MISQERWNTLSRHDQLRHIASEIKRAELQESEENRTNVLERALYLIDLSLADSKWRPTVLQLFTFRQEVARAYIGSPDANLTALYATL